MAIVNLQQHANVRRKSREISCEENKLLRNYIKTVMFRISYWVIIRKQIPNIRSRNCNAALNYRFCFNWDFNLFHIIKQLFTSLQVNSSNHSSSGMTIDPKQKTIDLEFVSVNSLMFWVNSHSLRPNVEFEFSQSVEPFGNSMWLQEKHRFDSHNTIFVLPLVTILLLYCMLFYICFFVG